MTAFRAAPWRDGIAYPPAPWHLNGHGLQALYLLPLKRARQLVPAPLRVCAVVPGYTIGAISAGHYDATGTLAYDELIVSPALVADATRTGFWISHIYVDSPVSQAGGQQIWNLDKRLARFEWSRDQRSVRVAAADGPLCSLRALSTLPAWLPPLTIPACSVHQSRCTHFRGLFRSSPHFGAVRCSIDAASPLASVVPDRLLLGCRHERASLTALAPEPAQAASEA
ncbi:MAG TPA: acetoacetate decarboxylase family protein [Polyangiaceae bacterium]|nr:acetoacetate decarboxylase family protein [Polyangiaceae bacterium]